MRSTRYAGILALLVGLASPARAANPTQLVPDLDQRRDGLPMNSDNVPGGMFCVPTAVMNTLYYFWQFGFGNLVQGSSFAPFEDMATTNINLLGWYMGTDGVNGTGGGTVSGLEDYLDDYASDTPMQLTEYAWDDNDEINDIPLKSWLGMDAIVNLNWARFVADDLSQPLYLSRSAGHETTLVGVGPTDNLGQWQVQFSDPITDEQKTDTSKQSTPFHVNTRTLIDDWANYDGTWAYLPHWTKPNSAYRLDAYIAIRPLFFAGPTGTSAQGFSVYFPKNDLQGGVNAKSVAITMGKGLVDLAFHPLAYKGAYLQNGSNTVWQFDIGNGTVTGLATLDNPRRITYGGPRRRLYVLDGSSLIALDTNGRKVASATSRYTLDTMAWDPIRQRLVAFSRSSGALFYYDSDLKYLGGDKIGAAIDSSGRLSLSIDSKSKRMWLHADGSPSLITVGYDASGAPVVGKVVLQTSGAPAGLFVDDRGPGRIYMSERDILTEYDLKGHATRVTPLVGSPAGPLFTIPRNYSNYDPKIYGPMNSDVADWDPIDN